MSVHTVAKMLIIRQLGLSYSYDFMFCPKKQNSSSTDSFGKSIQSASTIFHQKNMKIYQVLKSTSILVI